MLIYAASCAVLALLAAIALSVADRKSIRLRDLDSPPDDWNGSSLSVVVAARNEQRGIEPAMESLLQLDYPDLEVTVVNDRSTDETGAILDRLQERFPQLNVVHLTELPDGWLGKNHAQHLGAKRSRGEWLLFTDADVVFDPTALRRAIHWAEENQVDHVAAAPDIVVDGFLLNAFVSTFVVFFNAYFRPWRARNPNSKAYIGIGAFNLVRAASYRSVGGHEQLRLRPDDDVKLGKVLKLAGCRQDFLLGVDMVSVRWYASLSELIQGLEKNAFAGVEYNPLMVVASTAAVLAMNLFPFIGVFVASGSTQALFAFAALLWLYCCWRCCWNLQRPTWCCLGFPLAVLLLVYILWRTMLLNYWLGGIRWRDTLYPLNELRANRV